MKKYNMNKKQNISRNNLIGKEGNIKFTSRKDWMSLAKVWSMSFFDKHNKKSKEEFEKWQNK